jgi:hypothetical protein
MLVGRRERRRGPIPALTVPPNVKTVNAEPKPASRKKTSPDEEAIRGATELFTKAF